MSERVDAREIKREEVSMSIKRLAILLVIALFGGQSAFAQEEDAKLIDEVIARVNAGVIMRSAYESAQKVILERMREQGLKGEELEKRFKEQQARILDDLIDSQLLSQRAKDLSINVEPQVNQQVLRMMKEYNCESEECLGQKMKEAGFEMEELKKVLTERFSNDAVLSREVYYRVYNRLTEKDKKEAYDKYKDRFTEPAQVTLSRIFIAQGKDPNESLARAKDIADKARSGVIEFPVLAEKFSEDELGKKNKGLIGEIRVSELQPDIKTAVENAQVGTVTEPIKQETGYSIFRVDQRKEAKLSPYEDTDVQENIARILVGEQSEKQIDEYLAKLREEAFIEIDQRYQFENSKVKSAMIKRVPFMTEDERKQREKEREKEKEKERERLKKAAETQKATAKNK
jgi:parvulin-like peptidyl-prolyl isomerase